jgi:hypothetical protein
MNWTTEQLPGIANIFQDEGFGHSDCEDMFRAYICPYKGRRRVKKLNAVSSAPCGLLSLGNVPEATAESVESDKLVKSNWDQTPGGIAILGAWHDRASGSGGWGGEEREGLSLLGPGLCRFVSGPTPLGSSIMQEPGSRNVTKP